MKSRKRRGLCKDCLDKQRRIDELEKKRRRLEKKLRSEERKAMEELFGSSTLPSKIPVKADTLSERQQRRSGAKPGHIGHARQAVPPEEAKVVEGRRTRACGGGESATSKRSKRRRPSIVSAADNLIVVGEPSRAESPSPYLKTSTPNNSRPISGTCCFFDGITGWTGYLLHFSS